MTRVLVCGGRDFCDKAILWKTLDETFPHSETDSYGNWLPVGTLIHGDCPTGADALADEYAVVNWLDLKTFPANWEKYGRAAGPIRNAQMLDEGRPDIVIAFPGGRGTADMVSKARASGVPVIEVTP